MQAGNAIYETIADLPPVLPVFPLSGALLLPRTQLPLNIFEQRYLDMVDAALSGNRLIGMVQPASEAASAQSDATALANVGCVGRLTSFQETGDGRYLITLQGVTRFALGKELTTYSAFREVECDFAPFATDLTCGDGEEDVDRNGLLKTLRDYLDANNLEAELAKRLGSGDRGAGQCTVHDVPLRPAGETGAAGSARPEDARRNAHCHYRDGSGTVTE